MTFVKGRTKPRSRGSEKKGREQSEVQRLKTENLALKRQLTRMRKQLSRMNSDQFENVEEAIGVQTREDEIMRQHQAIEHWRCFTCKEDYLRLIIIQRPDGAFYFRKCPNCENRTRLKPLEAHVEGPPTGGLLRNSDKNSA